MKIKVIIDFYDREVGLVLRRAEEVLTVSENRGRFLIDRGFAEKVADGRQKLK